MIDYTIKTYMDEIPEYTDKTVRLLSQNPQVVGLLVNDPNVDIVEDEIDVTKTGTKQILSYNFIPDTQKDVKTYICVNTISDSALNEKIKSCVMSVSIYSHKQDVELDSSKFIGLIGCRFDNIARFADKAIRDNANANYGIGKIQLKQRTPMRDIVIGTDYVGKQLLYEVECFNKMR